MHTDITSTRKRTTLYAAFTGSGEPALGVWDWNRKRLETMISDRAANGEAFAGEHAVRVTVSFYNSIITRHGWPAIEVR